MDRLFINALNISKSFRHKTVFADISFSLTSGTLNAIVGENGAGKSTLLRILIGELKADKGLVETHGVLGYCPQQPQLFPLLTVKENIDYFASAYGLFTKSKNSSDWLIRRDTLLNNLGYTSSLNQRVCELSGGTQQKLNLTISLLHNPDILVLDEPYGGFDWETYLSFFKMILKLRDEGKCILLVTHLLNELKYFDRVYTLKAGLLQ
jgi:ABC-2 type transport system ATP-binding protein